MPSVFRMANHPILTLFIGLLLVGLSPVILVVLMIKFTVEIVRTRKPRP